MLIIALLREFLEIPLSNPAGNYVAAIKKRLVFAIRVFK
jgi:hypothetical protein